MVFNGFDNFREDNKSMKALKSMKSMKKIKPKELAKAIQSITTRVVNICFKVTLEYPVCQQPNSRMSEV